MDSLLTGTTVLDFSEYIAGPFCGFLLADFGARVIKIEPPDGAEERRLGTLARYQGNTRMSLAFNRGKESIAIDLQQSAGRELVYKMVADADVVVQNFAPGVAEKLGIDYETLAKINSKLVFLSSTAFGEVGPHRKRKGFDLIAHAASGVMSNYADEEGAPRPPGGIPYIDISTGMLNALSVVSALLYRMRSGEGQKIETSLFSTGVALQAQQMIQIQNLDARQHDYEVETLNSAFAAGQKHTEVLDKFANMRLREDLPDSARPVEVPDCLHRPTDRQMFPYYRVYQTHDGYISIAALHRAQRRKVCLALEIEDPDCDINPADLSDAQYHLQKSMMRVIEGRMRQQPSSHWIAKLESAGVPCAAVNYRSDLYTDPQANALGLVWDLNNKDIGNYKASGNPIRFSKTPIVPRNGAPSLGEHSDTVLRSHSYSDAEIASLRASGVVK